MEVFLLHEEPDEQAVEPGVQVPVEEAQVVADDVVAVVGELDALPLALAAPLALHAAQENLARHQLELFEPGQELRVEQGKLWISHGIPHYRWQHSGGLTSNRSMHVDAVYAGCNRCTFHLLGGHHIRCLFLHLANMSMRTVSGAMFSACASKLSMMRCRSAGR